MQFENAPSSILVIVFSKVTVSSLEHDENAYQSIEATLPLNITEVSALQELKALCGTVIPSPSNITVSRI